MKNKFFAVAVSLIISSQLFAIVISGGLSGGADNLNAPTDDPGWARVGRVGTNGSGVYLGNGWVITANHVSSKTYFTVDGDATYNKLDGAEYGVQLRNTTNTGYIDLYMFCVDTSVGGLGVMSDLAIASTPMTANKQCVHIGTGYGQSSDSETTWYVDTTANPYVWDTTPFVGYTATGSGYYWQSDRDTRWAFEDVSAKNYDYTVSGMEMEGFTTSFKDEEDYGITADKDSGSGLFAKNGGEWELVGIADLVGSYSGQPAGTSVYGNSAIYADLYAYSDQIEQIMLVPEPATIAILGIGAMFIRKRK